MPQKDRISLSMTPPAPPRRPTMVDVAALAGVGLKTVSRVVNAEPGVSPALEAKVRRAIGQLNYRLDADTVAVDNVGGAAEAVEHLLAHGHRRVAFLGDLPSISTAADRLRGYRRALRAAGIEPDDALIRRGIRDPDSAMAAVGELLS